MPKRKQRTLGEVVSTRNTTRWAETVTDLLSQDAVKACVQDFIDSHLIGARQVAIVFEDNDGDIRCLSAVRDRLSLLGMLMTTVGDYQFPPEEEESDV